MKPRPRQSGLRVASIACMLLGFTTVAVAADSPAVEPGFPDWEGYRNRLLPEPVPVTRQDFGWSPTRRAGGQADGELGGWVNRSLRPARYIMQLSAPATLDDRLEVEGVFAVTKAEGGSGVLIGWRNHDSAGWRTPNSIALRIDGNGNSFWLFFEYGTRLGLTGGGGAFEGERYQTTPTKPFPPDGKPHRWSLRYEPLATGGGTLRFRVDDRVYQCEVPAEHRAESATFDEFGIWNQETTGSGLECWFDDFVLNGVPIDLDRQPAWLGVGNHVEFPDSIHRPHHQFGVRPGDNGQPVLEGILFRDEKPAYLGRIIKPLTLDRELKASGRIRFTRAGADSGVYLGWFQAESKRTHDRPEYEERQRDYLGILLEGPSRDGHYVRPGYGTRTGSGRNAERGPILRPDGAVHTWSIHYRPDADQGVGAITTQLDGDAVTLPLAPGDRAKGATFDRFGLFNLQAGGWHVDISIDNLQFTGME